VGFFIFGSEIMLMAEVEARHSREAIEDEIRVFEERARQFQRGEIGEDDFRAFRLKHGIYGQRQPGVQMVRVKIPSGVLDAAQLRALAQLAEAYSTGRGHVTTRENCQFHFVQLDDVPSIMRLLAEAGLTTREACGNTVRNITSCPLAGVCPTEAFDVTPYALGLARFLLRHPDFHQLPRKFKIAFSGCAEDGACAVAGIHDIGFIARLRGVNGTARRGFLVRVGGGLGSLPTESAVLTEFLPAEELVPTTEAILRVFIRHGERKNRFKARMKFLLRAKGIAEFRRLVEEERARVATPARPLTVPSPIPAPLVNLGAAAEPALGRSSHFERWKHHNAQVQRQPGYALVWIKLPAGTVLTHQFRGLAELLEKHALGGVRIALSQDLMIPWVRLDQLPAVFDDLRALGLATPGARTITDVTACPGATTCNLGITRSLTLADVLAQELAGESDPEAQKIRIKLSGCPNSCGHHHLADIGFYGNARKIGGRQAPYYQLMLGGEVNEHGVRFARQVLPLPGKRVPEAIRELVAFYKQDRAAGEAFGAWAQRTPDAAIAARLARLTDTSDGAEDLFVDWGDLETYTLKLGRGECAG
jgi:sulfite reductase beta subunit-like hemoprotein